ncbi:hypothetical protein T4C_312 [Trichinella pseudospiralis]|uniref:Uncharacterized protein n=1 Tax=Trichinella pseudospiralis TaxID=6337 RepID=A0A0V1K105_TRIPS|nr:hypothetical protein T4C_312 [Trichinella pseudospiralis]
MIGILIALKKNEDADETKQSGKQKRRRGGRSETLLLCPPPGTREGLALFRSIQEGCFAPNAKVQGRGGWIIHIDPPLSGSHTMNRERRSPSLTRGCLMAENYHRLAALFSMSHE